MTDDIRERVARAIATRIHENIHDGYEGVPPADLFRRPRYQHLAERYALAADAALSAIPSPWRPLPAEPTPGVAPWDSEKFWGDDGEDAVAMFWHPGFQEFVSRFNRMTLAKGMTFEDTGLNYQDHSPVVHKPSYWMPCAPLPAPPADTRNDGGND